ncbi:MAG: putative sulfate exporter family transporter [Caulobacterales bacterium]|nr:putative sulfate exporter family transporter [Caulobacterales bacterium]
MASMFVSDGYGGPVMLYALLFGMMFHFVTDDDRLAAGIEFAAKQILRVGVALLGIQVTASEIVGLGAPTVALVIFGVAVGVIGGWAIARAFRLSSDFAVLSAGAVAICGASAALAISAALPRRQLSENNTVLVVVGVTTLSTVAMVLYPLLAGLASFNDRAAGVFLGATIHDVAQVVGAGHMVSDDAAEVAAVVKLMRVACLVPVVMAIAWLFRVPGEVAKSGAYGTALSWFLVAFVMLVAVNSTGMVSQELRGALSDGARYMLVTAVAALGVKTSLRDIVAVGPRPVVVLIVQSVLLCVFILVGLLLFINF